MSVIGGPNLGCNREYIASPRRPLNSRDQAPATSSGRPQGSKPCTARTRTATRASVHPEQAKGGSLGRQWERAKAYAETHGLELDTELTFEDLGVSAYRGANVETGRLGDHTWDEWVSEDPQGYAVCIGDQRISGVR
jgi:hypothetical protein